MNEVRNEIIQRNFKEAIEMLTNGKFYGLIIDTEDLEEVIGVLYELYKLEKYNAPFYQIGANK